jgi:cytochrome d ubiquinol oxidase subunit I
MDDPTVWHRLLFAFTIIYHYLFPQLTMGLAPLICWWRWRAWRTGDAGSAVLARFWTRILGATFAVGMVTGIPMEFQFGTNWAAFTKYTGAVIGQTLAMEGMFAFFFESAFIGALIWGEGRLSPRTLFYAALGVFLGSWASAYFILVTNAFMQNPVGYVVAPDGTLAIGNLAAYLLNPWALVTYAHNMTAALVTGTFVVAGVGAFHALRGKHPDFARGCLHWGTGVGLAAALLVAFPTGDQQAKMVAAHQPTALAGMEGRFESGDLADIALIGEPDVTAERLDNPIRIPAALSFLATGSFHGDVRGLKEFPRDEWPDNIEVLYYSFHIMVGLGTFFILLMGLANLQRWRGKLATARGLLWALLIAMPFPYIANTAGWCAAELGRQPWLVYHLFRTTQGSSHAVPAGSVVFTLLGWLGIYFLLGVLYLVLVGREILHGPGHADAAHNPFAKPAPDPAPGTAPTPAHGGDHHG